MTKVKELFGINTKSEGIDWEETIANQYCPYLNKGCIKTRKSQPEIAIGTCTMTYGKEGINPIIICPHRLLERRQIFTDCLHLLTTHVPGNELHIVSEVQIPGGNVDYFLVSAKEGKVKDFIGIELQTMDTTGTVWPERERFLERVGFDVDEVILESKSGYGMNWKMTAKTILVQLHHKIKTFEHLNKHLVLIVQDPLMDYMKENFSFSHVGDAKIGDPLHFHSYSLKERKKDQLVLNLETRLSTDTDGMAICLGLQAEAKVELIELIAKLEAKMSDDTLFTL
ncbi:Restriction endonuclease NotI [Schinkia azotoformans MEV2011]|uniref:Restriction endonuclease NotI n=1 Tax=Schinkia azotoformans MEV2011 TaxID=1348973 RepID=A0A072NGB3_SCHAZ|nr:NotI family restriction endonuclease [Schinkia azotoformans]KEF36292.1 Restriction endonuclease NotI [Schinkia azotoformans MEV2011]MEC1697875.1 NotI family restriction endonuclease [Schinkia azotoformans]MEC1723154.1 NotI family restriction endonuclease [Schinkia azotoformans]MEC1771872.1 NotI family restriction endonuclease [Schinkia azotoformans]MEC1780276.1 NotI family restriction endonuclease [Schinkia azotoformans]